MRTLGRIVGAALAPGAILMFAGCGSRPAAPVPGPTEYRAALVFDTPTVRAASKSMGHHFDQQAPEYSRRDALLGAPQMRGPAHQNRENPSSRRGWRVPAGHRGAIISH